MSSVDDLVEMVDRISIAAIEPNDIIVLHLGEGYTPEQGSYVREIWQRVTGLDNPVMIFPHDIDLEVKRPSDV